MGPDAANGLRGDNATALMRDRSGRLWVGTTAGLFVRDRRQQHLQPGGLARNRWPPATGRKPAGRQRRAPVDGHQPRRRVRAHADGGAWRPIVETRQNDARTLSSRRVMALVEAQPGEVWAGTLGQGVVAIDAISGKTRRLRHRPLLPSSLPDDHVRGLFRDRSGLVWVATYAGLARVDPRARAVLNVSPDRGVVDTTQSRADYASLMAHSDGRVWMGTLNHGVEIIDPQHGQLQALKPDPARTIDRVAARHHAGPGRSAGRQRVHRQLPRPLPGAAAGARARFEPHAPTVARISWPGRPPDRGVGPLLRDGAAPVGGRPARRPVGDGPGQRPRARRAARPGPSQLTDLRITALARGRPGRAVDRHAQRPEPLRPRQPARC